MLTTIRIPRIKNLSTTNNKLKLIVEHYTNNNFTYLNYNLSISQLSKLFKTEQHLIMQLITNSFLKRDNEEELHNGITPEKLEKVAGVLFERVLERTLTDSAALVQTVEEVKSQVARWRSSPKTFNDTIKNLLGAQKQLQSNTQDYLHLLDSFKLQPVINVIQTRQLGNNPTDKALTTSEALNLLHLESVRPLDIPNLLEAHKGKDPLPVIDARMQELGGGDTIRIGGKRTGIDVDLIASKLEEQDRKED